MFPLISCALVLLAPLPAAGSPALQETPAAALAGVDDLLARLAGEAGPERTELAKQLAGALPPRRILEALPLLADTEPGVRVLAAELMARPDLGATARRERVEALARVASADSDRRVIEAAVTALGRIGGPRAVAELGALTQDDMDSVAVAAAKALAGAAEGIGPLRELVRRSTATEGRPRSTVLVELLPRYGQWLADEPAATTGDHAPLVFSLRHPSREVRSAARRAFDRLISRLIDSAAPGRASQLLGELGRIGIGRDVAL
ncbi:MAG: HEAT repeat domain-containing protein, partial [Planctomycetota bacterium]